ncbi:hypothetical protein CHUAL_012357 [Chamberlinius hualienensis]
MALKKSFSCHNCKDQFKTNAALTLHYKKKHSLPSNPTKVRVTRSRTSLISTVESDEASHVTEEAAKTEKSSTAKHAKQQSCSSCSLKFPNIRSLRQHEKTCTGKSPVTSNGDEGYAEGIEDENQVLSPIRKSSRKVTKSPANSKPASAATFLPLDELSDDSFDDFEDDDEDEYKDTSGKSFKEQMKGKLGTVKHFLKETCGRKPDLCTTCDPGENKEWLKCAKCPKEFKLKASLDRHMKVVHLEGEVHKCDECGTRCADKGTLARHMYIHTGLKPYQCEKCKKQFSRKYHLFRHMQQTGCAGEKPPSFPCQVCGKLFSRNDNLREHLRIHAGDTNRKKKHVCQECKKEFHCPSMLKVHERMHTGEKPFACKVCPKAFPSEGALKKHCRVHTGERPYECKDCGARFSLKGTLNRHQRTHSGIRPHKCEFCGKEFIQIGGLKAHLFHHTGENGHTCEHCGKRFNRRARLQMHMRYVHDKVKPYTCDVCNKSFVRKEDLNRHAVLHSGVKAFQCPTCNKTFAIKPSLKLHLLTHTREEPKSCKACGRAFIRQDCLIRHVRKRHRNMIDDLLGPQEPKSVLEQLSSDVVVDNSDKQVQSLTESIKELLTILVDEATLKGFGWPDKPVDRLLEAVIQRCGHTPVNPDDFAFMDRLRENCKLLFTVVIDDTAVKTLLNNHTVDEVIHHVLKLAKT